MPYFNKEKKKVKDEKISPHHLEKYIKLVLDSRQAHQPYATCIQLVPITEDNKVLEAPATYGLQGQGFADLYDRHFSIQAFMDAVRDYRTALDLTS